MSTTINRVASFENISQNIKNNVLDTTNNTTNITALDTNSADVESVDLDSVFADVHNTFNPDNKVSISSSKPHQDAMKGDSRYQAPTSNTIQGDKTYQAPSRTTTAPNQNPTPDTMKGNPRYQASSQASYSSKTTTNETSISSSSPTQDTKEVNPNYQTSSQVSYSSRATTSGVSMSSTAATGVAASFSKGSSSNNDGVSVGTAGVGILSNSSSIAGGVSINGQGSGDNYNYGENTVYDTTNMVLTPNGTLSVGGIDLTQLTEEDFESLIGSMNQEEYDNFIKGIEDYYQVQIDILTDILEKEDTNGNKGLNEQLDEVNKVVMIIKSSAEANSRYGASENPSTIAVTLFKNQLESVGVNSYEELLVKQSDLQNKVNEATEAIKACKNAKDSAKYDYLGYLDEYNKYEYHKITQEELDSLEKDSNYHNPADNPITNILANVSSIGKKITNRATFIPEFLRDDSVQTDPKAPSFSYTAYQKKHPDVSPMEFIQMVEAKYPGGYYRIIGIPNTEDVRALAAASDKYPEMAKTYSYLYEKDPKRAEQYLKECKYEINNIKGQLEAEAFLELLAEKDGNSDDAWEWACNALNIHEKGVNDGIETFFRGLYHAGEAKFTGAQKLLEAHGFDINVYENRTMDVSEYRNMYILWALMSKEDKQNKLKVIKEDGSLVDPNSIIDFSKEYTGSILSYDYEISQGIGNMIPSMMLSAVNPALGSVAMGVSAGGNSYHGAMIEGHSYISSFLYGVFSGSSEAITERIFGGLPGLSDVQVTGLKTYLQSMIKEGNQEMIQGIMDAAYKYSFMGEELPTTKEEWEEFALDIVKQGAYGAITAGYMNVPSVVGGTITVRKFNEYMEANNVSKTEQQAAIDAIRKSDPELAKMTDEAIIVNFGMNVAAQVDLQRIQKALDCDKNTAFAIMQHKLSSADAIKLVERVKSGTSIEEALNQLKESSNQVSEEKGADTSSTSTEGEINDNTLEQINEYIKIKSVTPKEQQWALDQIRQQNSDLKNLPDDIIKSEYPYLFIEQLEISIKVSLGIHEEIAKIMVQNNTSEEIATYMYENNIESVEEALAQLEDKEINIFPTSTQEGEITIEEPSIVDDEVTRAFIKQYLQDSNTEIPPGVNSELAEFLERFKNDPTATEPILPESLKNYFNEVIIEAFFGGEEEYQEFKRIVNNRKKRYEEKLNPEYTIGDLAYDNAMLCTAFPAPQEVCAYLETVIQELNGWKSNGTYPKSDGIRTIEYIEKVIQDASEMEILPQVMIDSFQQQLDASREAYINHQKTNFVSYLQNSEFDAVIAPNGDIEIRGLEPNSKYNLEITWLLSGWPMKLYFTVRTDENGVGKSFDLNNNNCNNILNDEIDFSSKSVITLEYSESRVHGETNKGYAKQSPFYAIMSCSPGGYFGINQGIFSKANDFFHEILEGKLPIKIDEYKLNQLQEIVRKYIPGLSDADIIAYLKKLDSEGACSHTATINQFILQIYNKPDLFRQIFGYDLYRKSESGEKILNGDLLLADYYTYLNRDNKEIFDFDGNNVTYTDPKTHSGQVYSDANNFEEFLNWKLEQSGSDVRIRVKNSLVAESNYQKDFTQLSQILHDGIHNEGNSYKLSFHVDYDKGEKLTMYKYNPNTGLCDLKITTDEWFNNLGDSDYESGLSESHQSGHAVTIIDASPEGIYVQSWGKLYFIPFESLPNSEYYISKFVIEQTDP